MKRRNLIIAILCGVATPLLVLAYSDWEGPSATPPANNPDGPVWLQNSASTVKQTGKIDISGGANDDIFMSSGSAIRGDLAGASTINVGNFRSSGATGFNFDIYGNLNIKDNDKLAPWSGRINVYEICLNNAANGTNCRTTWPSGSVTDVWVNTTGDTMTGKLTLNGVDTSGVALDVNGGETVTVSSGWPLKANNTTNGSESILATDDFGIEASGPLGGGYFNDSNSSGYAYVGYGHVGIQGYGNSYGGYFKDADGSGASMVGYGDEGINSYGNTMGGRFIDSNDTASAYIAYGTDSFYATNGNINANDYQITNIRGIQLKDYDDDSGGDDNKYRLLGRDGAWQFFNGGVVVGNYDNGTWTDLANGKLVVETTALIGSSSEIDTEPLQVYQNDSGSWLATFANTSVTCHISSSGAINCSSDARLKNDIQDFNKGLNEIMQLRPVTFKWKNDESKLTYTGFIAQEVQEVMPELVETQEDGYLSLDKTNMMPYVINAIQELKQENDALKKRVEELENAK